MSIYAFNNSFTQNGVSRSVGLRDPLDEFSVTYQVYFETIRSGEFMTPYSSGHDSFSGAADYAVAFVGNGVISNNWAIGSDGNDTYHASLAPVAGRWYRQVFRRRRITQGSSYEQLYYFDVPTNDFVSRDSTSANIADASAQKIQFLTNPWTTAEGVDGRIANIVIFNKGDIPINYLFKQSLSWQLVSPEFKGSVWAQYRCGSTGDLRDLSGHGRHLSIVDNGSNVTTRAHAPSKLSWRESVGSYNLDGSSSTILTSTVAGLINPSGTLSGFVKLPKYTVKIG